MPTVLGALSLSILIEPVFPLIEHLYSPISEHLTMNINSILYGAQIIITMPNFVTQYTYIPG
jgi:hypothetical protein